MTFNQVSKDWTRLGAEDPLWAVYVAPGTRGGRWDVEQFLAKGRCDVATALAWLDRLGLPRTWQRVLDFGCGAGRLTQALADYADTVVGVDVSEPMLFTARGLDRTHGRCEFVHNDRPNLRRFEDASFDLVYSELVLQHLPARLIDDYLAEFMRVLRPGGTAVLHCTTSPLWTPKGVVWRFLPGPLVRLAQRALLGYPAPMRMTAFPPARVRGTIGAHGGIVVHTRTEDNRTTHWRSTRYAITKPA